MVPAPKADCAHLFPTLHSMEPGGWPEIGHGGRITTTEIGKHYKSAIHISFSEDLNVKDLPGYHYSKAISPGKVDRTQMSLCCLR